MPKLFQGKLERQIICGKCKQKSVKVEDFLNLSLNMIPKNNKVCKPRDLTQRIDFAASVKDFFKADTLDSDN